MAATSMLGLQSTTTVVSSQRARVPSSPEAAGLPALRISAANSSLRGQSCQLRSEFLPTFGVSIAVHRRKRFSRVGSGKGGALTSTSFASDATQLKEAREEIKKVLAEKKAHPIFIRLGWHDAGSYDKNISEWPKRGGANGSLRFSPELAHGANAGLINALKILEPVKEKFPNISYADLFQLASATAIEDAGGPHIPMKYGRVDTASEEECAIEGNLPDGAPPNPADHLREVFYRMGLDDKEIVALSGAHTVGRSRPERSGFGKAETKYTNPEDKDIGAPGGQSWTVEWLKFDNSYFKDIKAQSDEDLLVLPTDKILTEDPEFKVYTDKYAEDQETFFKDYAEAHAKLSELGSKWDPPEGFSIDEEPEKISTDEKPEKISIDEEPEKVPEAAPAPVPEKFVAAKYSVGGEESPKRELSETMKEKIRAEYLGLGGSPDKPLKSNYFLNIIIVIAVLAILSSLVTQN